MHRDHTFCEALTTRITRGHVEVGALRLEVSKRATDTHSSMRCRHGSHQHVQADAHSCAGSRLEAYMPTRTYDAPDCVHASECSVVTVSGLPSTSRRIRDQHARLNEKQSPEHCVSMRDDAWHFHDAFAHGHAYRNTEQRMVPPACPRDLQSNESVHKA
jgi:hypothetical protein